MGRQSSKAIRAQAGRSPAISRMAAASGHWLAIRVSRFDPQLQLSADGLWRPGPASPAINGGSGDFSSLISDDMDGQPRLGIFDIGADEVSNATIVRRPLGANDVGPAWKNASTTTPPGGGCNGAGCAIQAENYTAVLDPDGDGFTWAKANVATALGGQVIKAPNGSIVSDPTMPKATATYDMTFQTAGTYSAYYRVRGFSGSTDSIYTPSGFAINPDNSLSTSQDSTFTWKKDSRTFVISAANTGVPLEFRLGMREQQAEIDAIVLNLSSSLTSAQLDKLFAILPGDYNGDGIVDAADYTTWRDTLGSTTALAADGDGNHLIDQSDFDIWKANYGKVAGTGATVISVPEPPSVQLLILGLVVGFGRQHGTKSPLIIVRESKSESFLECYANRNPPPKFS